MKKVILTIALALNFSLIFSSNTFAAVTEKENSPSIVTVTDSKFIVNKQARAETRWVMLRLTKNDKTEMITGKVENSRISMNVYLRDGAGTYKFELFESSAETQYSNSYYLIQTTTLVNRDTRDLSFLLPSNLVQSDNEEIIALSKSLTEGSKSELEALKKIHEYVAKTVEYDFESYYNGTFASKPYDAVGMLKRSKGVCSGYSNLYAALTRVAGIKTKIIEGTAYLGNGQTGQHAWNEVFINNEWKSVDVTWDSVLKAKFKYFLMAEEEFAKDHQKEKEILAN